MLQHMLKDKMNAVRGANTEDILASLGLQARRSSIEIIGSTAAILATGMVLGAGLALLMAPKSGQALRSDIKARANQLAERIGDKTDGSTREETAHRRA